MSEEKKGQKFNASQMQEEHKFKDSKENFEKVKALVIEELTKLKYEDKDEFAVMIGNKTKMENEKSRPPKDHQFALMNACSVGFLEEGVSVMIVNQMVDMRATLSKAMMMKLAKLGQEDGSVVHEDEE